MMAEAFAAAGLASSIVTFFEFSIRLARLTKSFHDAYGDLPIDLRQCQRLVDDLTSWVQDVQARRKAVLVPTVPTRNEMALEKAIRDTLVDCEQVETLFKDLLPKPPLTTSPRKKVLAKMKSALRLMRKEGRINQAIAVVEARKNSLGLVIGETTLACASDTW